MTGTLSRIELMHGLTAILRDEAVIAGIGNTNFDLYAAGHRPQNFYMLGSMGLALPIAFGVALAPAAAAGDRIEGDGSLLMDLGCLATIAMVAPPNLTLVVMDNAVYEITGGQRPRARSAAISSGCPRRRIAHGDWAQDTTDFVRLMQAALERDGPSLIGARIARGALPGNRRAIRLRFAIVSCKRWARAKSSAPSRSLRPERPETRTRVRPRPSPERRTGAFPARAPEQRGQRSGQIYAKPTTAKPTNLREIRPAAGQPRRPAPAKPK